MQRKAWLLAVLAVFAFYQGLGCGGGGGSSFTDTDTTTELSDTDAVDFAEPDLNDTDQGDIDLGDSDQTQEGATLNFVLKYGPNSKTQFPALWAVSVPGYDGDGAVVFMLCRTDDPNCSDPVLMRELTEAERGTNKIQNSFGPSVSLRGLPEGEFLFMIFEDSSDSEKRGFGWQDDFPTREEAWGGVVSESDLMLVAENDSPASAYNPPPAPRQVTLSKSAPVELGDLWLAHYHQRDISVLPESESGMIVAAVDQGVRVVQLNDFSVKTAYEFGGQKYYDYIMLDEADEGVDGRVCGMVEGPNKTVFVLYLDATGTNSGFAIHFDPINGQQLSRKRVIFPGTQQDFPCRGLFHEHEGQQYLWVTNASGPDKASEKFWYVNIAGLDSADVTASVLDNRDDAVYRAGIDRMAAHGDRLYMVADANVAPCNGLACAFKASFDATGRPTFLMDGTDYDVFVGAAINAGTTNAQGEISCVTAPPAAGLAIAPFHDGRNLLFLGLCLEVQAFDLASGEKLDYNGPAPGRPGLDASLFGQGFVHFDLSPDGKTLWAVSNDKSVVHLYFQRGIDGNRQSYNRWMFLPIDLSAGDLPGVSADWSTVNIDDYEGRPDSGVGTYDSPAVDPGLDLDFAFLKKYIVFWAGDLAGATPTSIPVGPSIAVANNTLWLRGSGIPGVSGLANQGNLGTFSLSEGQVVLWPRGDEPFYQVWTSGVDTNWGFDLTPETTNSLATYGIFYFTP
ncbi:MAG: hypothetical protein RBU37_20075 [Myxococcota bacterium]|nr:hypothetical protein [Myxococcota bacterium]